MERYREGGGGGSGSRTQESPVKQANWALVSYCQASSDKGQKQYYRAVGLARRKNNSCCVPEPLEHPNSWEIGGPSVARSGALRTLNFSLSAFPWIPGPPSSHLLLLMPGRHQSFYSHLFTFLSFIRPCVILWVQLSPLPTSAENDKRELQKAMRKPETGRGSEQCQQIREVQKPPQEACQSSSITRASETQRKTWELQTVQECHRSQQRVHKQHQIKPQQYVLFYSGNTPVGKAICRVNRALLYTLMYQRASYADRTVNFPAFACV